MATSSQQIVRNIMMSADFWDSYRG